MPRPLQKGLVITLSRGAGLAKLPELCKWNFHEYRTSLGILRIRIHAHAPRQSYDDMCEKPNPHSEAALTTPFTAGRFPGLMCVAKIIYFLSHANPIVKQFKDSQR